MIDPTQQDIGRTVIYRDGTEAAERGTITSFNDQVVFVRYGRDTGSKATMRPDLTWRHPR